MLEAVHRDIVRPEPSARDFEASGLCPTPILVKRIAEQHNLNPEKKNNKHCNQSPYAKNLNH